LDLLAANLDGDQVIEFAAARTQAAASPIAILDFDDCDGPVVTATAAYGELRQGLLSSNGLFAVERRKISRWSYLGPTMISEVDSTVATGAVIERVAFGSTSGAGMAVVDLGAGWTYAPLDRTTGFGNELSAAQPPLGWSAYFGQGEFLHGDELGLRRIDLGFQVEAVASAPDVEDPIVVSTDEGDSVIAARADDELLVIAWKDGASAGMSMVDFGTAVIAGPVPARSNDEIRLFVLLEDGRLASCQANEDTGACPISAGTKQLALAEIDDERSLLTAFIDGDSWPDLVFVSVTGKVFFQRGAALDADAAPMIDLGRANHAAPAIALDFFSAYGRAGSLLVVPHDRSLSLIPFAGRQDQQDSVWPQHRRDSLRSARLQ
jgi:hypothetical protein